MMRSSSHHGQLKLPFKLPSLPFHFALIWVYKEPKYHYLPLPLETNTLPTLPKHTQLQKITEQIQVATPTQSPPSPIPPGASKSPAGRLLPLNALASHPRTNCNEVGAGIQSGFTASSRAVPKRPMDVERSRPAVVRSRRYQRKGFVRARVRESWRVVSQGSLRCSDMLVMGGGFLGMCMCVGGEWKGKERGRGEERTIAKAMPIKAPMLRTTSDHSTVCNDGDGEEEDFERERPLWASIQGRRLPIAIPAAPQNDRYMAVAMSSPPPLPDASALVELLDSSLNLATNAPYASPTPNKTPCLRISPPPVRRSSASLLFFFSLLISSSRRVCLAL